MASRNAQDAFMDDSDESCPLCVEEFDLSDKNFRPCPCGYQVCQFCYNNIKNNMNGLCPACRRPYDEQSIEWKIVSPEEQKADIELQARKKAAARKKESERKQVETNNRKHLAGLRVVQKNLVYVVGLTQKSSEEDFLQTLRGDQYFGQYGKIIKIVVSKAKEGSHNNNTVGVYVTFERREDAAKCIAAVDGSKNLDRPLRAQYGTTKYCSAYLRNEQCQNRSCTFLHETGEDYDSFSRQDLSSMNAMSTQRPAQPTTSSSSVRPSAPQPQPPPQQAPQNISAASHSSPQPFSRDEPLSQNDNAEGPALPSHANWAARNAVAESLRSSKSPSVSTPSPVVSHANVAPQPSEPGQSQQDMQGPPQSIINDPMTVPRRTRPKSPFPLERAMKILTTAPYNPVFDRSAWPEEDLRLIDAYPPLFAPNGGHVKLSREKEAARQRQQQEEDRNVIGAMSAADEDDNPASGSFQLGGEPDTQVEPSENSGRLSGQRLPSFAQSPTNFPFGGTSFQQGAAAKLPRTLTPQQHQQLAVLRSSANSRQGQINHSQFQQGYGQNTSSLHGQQQSNPFQMQMQGQGFGSGQGHTRQASRFTFANDSASASTAVKPAANPQLMAQQSAMMPPHHNKQYHQSNSQNNHFFSGVQGPPPGLKSSGTPPISGGGMFGQGHGFASAMGGSAGYNGNAASKNTNDELMRDLLRSRNGSLNGQGSDLGKREFNNFPFTQKQHMTSDAPVPSLLSSLYGPQSGSHYGYQDHGLQKQKKKGKKHRHANTSSSGGGGIVDLADPSILQARMHHGVAGQGQYGAQGQESPIAPLDTGSLTGFSLGIISRDDTRTVLPAPLGPSPSKPAPVPPGLSSAQDFPPLAAPNQPPLPAAPKPSRKVTSKPSAASIKPVVPVITANVPGKSLTKVSQHLSDKVPFDDKDVECTHQAMFESNDNSQPSQAASRPDGKKAECQYDIVSPLASTTRGLEAPKTSEKRGRPEKLDLQMDKEALTQGKGNPASHEKSMKVTVDQKSHNQISSHPTTPATIPTQSSAPNSARKSQTRTTQVTEKFKHEASSPGAIPSQSSGQVSRRPSITSLNRPETPFSEKISDNLSYTSAPISRTNSPPPSRVGSAPIRRVTKSQQKKERQERAKKNGEVAGQMEETVLKSEEAVVQAPIIGRKKKTKKAKEKIGTTADSTPTVTRPPSPESQEAAAKVPPSSQEDAVKGLQQSNKQVKLPPIASLDPESNSSAAALPPVPESDQGSYVQSTVASIFASLRASDELPPNVVETLFKSVTGANHRLDQNLDPKVIVNNKLETLKLDQIARLDNDEPLVVFLDSNNAVVILPNRRCMSGLTPFQANRYRELYMQGARVSITPPNKEDQALIDSLMPVHEYSGERAPVSALGSADSRTTTQLNNRFAEPLTPQAMPPAVSSVRLDASLSRKPHTRSDKPVLGLDEAESAVVAERKNTEGLEKRLNALIKKNRRLVLGSGN